MNRIIIIFMTSLILLIASSASFGDYVTSENPHGAIKWACDDCHSTESWTALKKDMAFNHSETGFTLLGVHKTATCKQCHKTLKFSHIGVECADCHTDIHRGQFGTDCQNCHTPQDWQNREEMLQKHIERGFPLLGVHAVADCDACHIRQGRDEYAGTPVECEGCHIDNFNATGDPNHRLADFSLDCRECHLPVASSWQDDIFQHTPAFQLSGAHALTDCNGCHSQTFAGTPNICVGCHESAFNGSSDPPHVTLGFPTDCELCHNQVRWDDATFDHVQASGFELNGAHALIDCNACHAGDQYDLPRECFGCHQQDYQGVTDPNHAAGNFPTDCTMCHSETAWSPANFDHNITQFPLTGAHQTVPCTQCHINNQYTGTPTDCWSCHEDDYRGADDPDHEANNFSQDCTECHSTAAWEPATFDHNQTNFPLTGAHTTLNCLECHASGYSGTPTDCWSCHENDYRDTDDPDHELNNFSHDCTECHNTNGWDTDVFNHSQTDFPLTGAHTTINCIACHADGYSNMPTDCWSCHEDDYQGTTDPDHQQNNFDQDCTQCHGTAAWQPASFDHAQTNFPLTGAHTTLNCIQCHADGYSGTPADCWSCHQDDYQGTTDPDHQQNNFDQDCTQCHGTAAWQPASFDHAQTNFPLTGAHTTLNCIQCHADGYSGTPTDCWSCHQEDYQGTTDPNHQQNNFDQDCTQCHSTEAWDPSTFDHNQTNFPLSGAHLTLNCLECHADGYSGTPADCWSCHRDDYNGVADPDHAAGNFDHDCLICHNTSQWPTDIFDHSVTDFPLTGAHTTLVCDACHSGGYNNTPVECLACHESDYNNATNPDHQAAGFPTTCENCHNTSNWDQTTWDHDGQYFPIYSGRHQNEWNLCADCHVNPNDYSVFECILCHEHNRADTDDRHQNVPGYVYESSACYNCHPTGEQ